MPQTCKLTKQEIRDLELVALNLRRAVIGMIYNAKSGHPAGALGTADIFAVLFFHTLKEGDRFVLSNGHICAVLYAALAHKGEISIEELNTYRKMGSRLQGHPHNCSLPQVLTSSGPLGQGLSQAVGMALAYKMDKKKGRIFCMTSDAELQEGQTWEAAMFGGDRKLSNITWIIDRNQIQISGETEKVMPLESLKSKLESFNWKVEEIDGHDIASICNAFDEIEDYGPPTAVVAHTIPGKGVKFMECKSEWHGKAPNKEETDIALGQLDNIENNIRRKYDHK